MRGVPPCEQAGADTQESYALQKGCTVAGETMKPRKLTRQEILSLAQRPGRLDVADVFDLAQGCRQVVEELSQAEIELRNARAELVDARAGSLSAQVDLGEGHRKRVKPWV